ncbi:MAG: tetratricopeptide repeat protein, partial [Planctomycetota bacterium]
TPHKDGRQNRGCDPATAGATAPTGQKRRETIVPEADRTRARTLTFLLCSLGLVVTAAVYVPVLDAGFYFDDEFNILDASGVHWTGLSRANLEGLFSATLLPTRIVANLTFALNHLAGGLEPRGYHAVNVLIHLMVGGALAWTTGLYLRASASGQSGQVSTITAACAATLIFLLHPLNVQAVAYVVQRMTSLAALFSILAFGCFLKGREPGRSTRSASAWFVIAGLWWLVGVGSKENALLVPFVVAAYEVSFHRHSWRRRIRSVVAGGWRTRLTVAVAVVLILASGWAVLEAYVGENSISLTRTFPTRDFNGWERMLTQSRVQVHYLSLLFWPAPSRLNLDHQFTPSRGWVEPGSTLAAVLFWIGTVAGVGLLAARRPRYGFPLLAYVLLHSMESGPVNLELVFEHRMYLPLAAATWLLAALLDDLAAARRGAVLMAVLPVALLLGGATLARNRIWADPIAFHYDCADKSPDKYRPQFNLGSTLGREGRIEEAMPFLRKALELDPGSSEAHNQLGSALLLRGESHKALAHYRNAVDLNPENAEAVYNLALVLERHGELEESLQYYRRFVQVAPPFLSDVAESVRRRLAGSTGQP